mgnify:CR=1 FL=1
MPAWDVGKGTTKQSYDAGRTGNHNTNGVADNNRETYRTSNAYKASAKKAATISKANKIKQDMVDFKNYSYTPPKFVPSIVGSVASKLFGKKSFEVNKSYYEKNLIGKTNLATGKAYSASVDDYKSYMSARGSGSIDAMGREIVGGNGGGQLVEKNIGGRTLLTTTPTTAEVSQSNAAQVEDSEELRKKRVKAKGRSPTIMTGVTGVTGGLTLGKPSLLGRA